MTKDQERQAREYGEQALWTALNAQRRVLASAELAAEDAYRAAERAKQSLEHHQSQTQRLQEALVEAINGDARVTWDDESKRFAVVRKSGAKFDLPVPEGAKDGHGKVPPNAAHVGSTNQGQVAR
ncbi:MAG TPA: hypothetical protein VK509_10910 [Polyangiales bacterium]|nr:hypothetical protein [Polyangiales bacterium]